VLRGVCTPWEAPVRLGKWWGRPGVRRVRCRMGPARRTGLLAPATEDQVLGLTGAARRVSRQTQQMIFGALVRVARRAASGPFDGTRGDREPETTPNWLTME